jgi:hypothetical protein
MPHNARDTAGWAIIGIAVALIWSVSLIDSPTRNPTSEPGTPLEAAEPTQPMPEDFFNWEKHGVADHHGWFQAPSYTDADRKRWIAENPEQYKAYSERRRQGEYANLILFDSYCPDLRFINSIRSRIFAEWNVLPVEQRTHVLDHELHMIHKQYDGFRDPESGEWIKGGGMKRFCEYTDEDIRKGYWNHVILNGAHTK